MLVPLTYLYWLSVSISDFSLVCTCPKIWHCIYLCILPVPMPRVLKCQKADMTLVDESHQVMDYLESLFSWL